MCFSQPFIFGRAIYSSYLPPGHNVDENEYNNVFSILLLKISPQDYSREWKGQDFVTGALVLESTLSLSACDIQAIPTGVLYFTCSVTERNTILQQASYSQDDIMEGKVVVHWKSKCQMLTLYNIVSADEKARTIEDTLLWQKWGKRH